MNEAINYLLENLGGVSIGAVALMVWRILVFFKKDKYVLPFMNEVRSKANGLFGKANVVNFLDWIKDIKLKDVQNEYKTMIDKLDSQRNVSLLLLKVYKELNIIENPDLIEEIDKTING